MRNAFVLCCSIALLGSIGTASAEDWTKSKWGPDDEIGSANYMTPELVMKAASLVKTGKTYPLGIPVDTKTPAYPPRTFKITIVQPGQAGSAGIGPNKATYNDDILDTWVGIGSQLDGLGHLADPVRRAGRAGGRGGVRVAVPAGPPGRRRDRR